MRCVILSCFFLNFFFLPAFGKKNTKPSGEEATIQFETLLIDAISAKNIGDSDKAMKLLEKCSEIKPQEGITYFELSKLHATKKNIDGAMYLAEKAHQLDPENKWYATHLAGLYASVFKREEALEIYESYIDKFYYKLNIYVAIIDLYQQLGNMEKIIEYHTKLENIMGVVPQNTFQISNQYLGLGKPIEAAEVIKKLIKIEPNNVEYYNRIMDIYSANNITDSLEKVKSKVQEIAESNPDFKISLAEYYYKNRDMEKFYNIFYTVLTSDTFLNKQKGIFIENMFGEIVKDTKQIERLNITLESLKKKTEYADFYMYQARLLLIQNRGMDTVIANVEKAIELDPKKLENYRILFNCYINQEQHKKLIEYSNKALSYYPTQPFIYFYRGASFSSENQWEKAKNTLKKGLRYLVLEEDKPMKLDFYSHLGYIHWKLKETETSFEYYEKALEIDPSSPFILNNYSYFLSLSDDKSSLEKARLMSQKSNLLSKNNPTYQDTYGWIMYKMNNFSKALKWLKLAVDNSSESPSAEIYSHYAQVLYETGEEAEALKYWEKSLEVDSTLEDVKEKIKQLKKADAK